MRKSTLIPLIGIAGLLALLLVLTKSIHGIVNPVSKIDTTGTTAHAGQKPENIDSLVTLIRKDTHYHVQDVIFDYKDSNLVIIIAGEECSTRYFNETYHIPAFQSIDGIKILSTYHRELDSYSKRGARLLAAFKDKWCCGDECGPLTSRIKKDMRVPESYKSVKLWIYYLGDSSFVVTNLFQQQKTSGHRNTQRAHAQIDMKGAILVYDTTDNPDNR